MNKLELIRKLKENSNLTKNEASEIVKIFFNEMTNALINREHFEIRIFCSFTIKEYKSYTGRNPKTGETVKIHAKRLPFFKCGKELKDRVD